MYKYLVRDFKNLQIVDSEEGTKSFQINLQKFVEIPTNSPVPKPYIIHNPAAEESPELTFNIDFHDIEELYQCLGFMKTMNAFEMESNMEELIF